MFWNKKTPKKSYDRENTRPAIRSSICTGEQVAGFVNQRTGKFEEIQLIKSPRDLEEFLNAYGLTSEEVSRIY